MGGEVGMGVGIRDYVYSYSCCPCIHPYGMISPGCRCCPWQPHSWDTSVGGERAEQGEIVNRGKVGIRDKALDIIREHRCMVYLGIYVSSV